jgi:competence protein ComEC
VLGMIRAQVVLFVCMAPLLVATVGQLPLTAPLANMIAVPVVTLVIVPCALLGSALLSVAPALATGILSVSGWAAAALVVWLEALSSWPEPMEGFAPDAFALALASAGAALWLVPLPLRWRVLSLPLLAALFQPALPPPAFGEFRLRMFDVGQGLAVVVDTARHRLIYDAGPRFASGFDAGESIVVPAVRARGGRHASLLMISHDHADHAGGGETVRRALVVRHWQGGGGFSARPLHAYCRAGDRWQWDGVEFEVLYPREPWRLSANDGSCVLEIRNGRHAVLLPGDIELRAEAALVQRQLLQPVDILVAPHHGSRTSSTPAFLNALRPAVVLVSSGHRNRYGHPHDIVMARYHARSARVYVTAVSGEIGWDSARPGHVAEYRAADRRYWRAPVEPLPNAGGSAAP